MQNALAATRAEAISATCGRLEFCCCRSCGFVVNAAFDADLTAYDQHYENSQHHSPAFSSYIDALVDRMVKEAGAAARVVEVGCGKGVFLRRLVERLGGAAQGTGFDPTYIGPESALGGRLRFVRRFYDAAAAAVPADLVVCRHVIEHVQEPMAMLHAVHDAVAEKPHARIFFETPCVEWILERGVAWDFFHEHCSLFTVDSLSYAFESAGFLISKVEHLFGGQYLLLEARPRATSAPTPSLPRAHAAHTGLLAARFAIEAERRRARWQEIITEHSGRCAVWGAGAKGVTLLNMLDPSAQRILAAVDINPAKQGRFVPGTGHRCIAPAEIRGLAISAVLATNPNYLDEIRSLLGPMAADCTIINLMEPSS